MFDMMKMMGTLKNVQEKIKEAQNNLDKIHCVGEAGGGMVQAIVTGKHQVLKIDVDVSLIVPQNKEMLQDLVVAALNKAMEEVEKAVRAEMKKSTDGLLPNIPGMDISSMIG